MTTLPAWVSHALDHPTQGGRGTVRVTRCPHCYRVVLKAHDYFTYTCEPHPLTALAEVLALTDGRTTYTLLPTRLGAGHKRLRLRLPQDITRHPVGTPHRPFGHVDVVCDHRCQPFTYPTAQSAYHPPALATVSADEGTFDDLPPF